MNTQHRTVKEEKITKTTQYPTYSSQFNQISTLTQSNIESPSIKVEEQHITNPDGSTTIINKKFKSGEAYTDDVETKMKIEKKKRESGKI